MQIEEFSHLTGKLVFGILLVILIYYKIFLCRLEESVLAKWLRIFLSQEKLWDGKKKGRKPGLNLCKTLLRSKIDSM